MAKRVKRLGHYSLLILSRLFQPFSSSSKRRRTPPKSVQNVSVYLRIDIFNRPNI